MSLQVDSPWCWLQALSAFLFHAVFFGLVYSFGIFYVAILQEFPGRESEAAWITGINFGVLMLMSPFTIYLLERMPARVVCCTGTLLGSLALYIASKASSMLVLYMTFGVMHGVGTNFCYISSIWILRKNFQRHRDLVFGLSSSGSGAGGIIYGIILPIFVESHGWRGALEIVSYITLGCVIVSMVMIPVEQESESEKSESAKPEKKSLLSWKRKGIRLPVPSPWRNRAFVVLTVTVLLCAFVSSVPYCHIVNYSIHQGVRRSEGDRFPLFISIGSLLGRITVGRVSGFRGVSRITLCQITFMIECLATTLATLAANTAGLTTFSMVFGFCDGAFQLLVAVVVDDVFVDKNQAMRAIGQLFQLLAIPYAFGAPLAGWLYTQTGSYHIVFFLCGGILFIAACLVSLARYFLPPALDIPILALPEQIVIAPVDENSRDLVPVQHRNSTRLISSRACSFLDLAVEVYANENRAKFPAYLEVEAGGLDTRNERDRNACSLAFLSAENKGDWYDYTDITNQISGLIDTIYPSTNQNEAVPYNNDVIALDCHVSDTSSLDYVDNVYRSSGVSTDDDGYWSAPAPAKFVDSVAQSTTSQNDVGLSVGSRERSLESLIKVDFIEDEKAAKDYKGCSAVDIEDFERATDVKNFRRLNE